MKGFGFISRDDGQPDAFVHISAVERAGLPTINEGDRFEFDIEVDRRGKYAAVNLSAAVSNAISERGRKRPSGAVRAGVFHMR